MEANKWTRPDLGNIRALLDLYSVSDQAQRESILALARQSREKGWWAKYQEIWRGSLPGFEAEASMISMYENLRVPGLFQAADYATAIFKGSQVLDDDQIHRRVEARLARQGVLHGETPPTLWTVIDEAALAKAVGGPSVMRNQLQHIVEVRARTSSCRYCRTRSALTPRWTAIHDLGLPGTGRSEPRLHRDGDE
ncbi:DUF5753 domain-containing protein [Nonomuraea bangladeshensis]